MAPTEIIENDRLIEFSFLMTKYVQGWPNTNWKLFSILGENDRHDINFIPRLLSIGFNCREILFLFRLFKIERNSSTVVQSFIESKRRLTRISFEWKCSQFYKSIKCWPSGWASNRSMRRITWIASTPCCTWCWSPSFLRWLREHSIWKFMTMTLSRPRKLESGFVDPSYRLRITRIWCSVDGDSIHYAPKSTTSSTKVSIDLNHFLQNFFGWNVFVFERNSFETNWTFLCGHRESIR